MSMRQADRRQWAAPHNRSQMILFVPADNTTQHNGTSTPRFFHPPFASLYFWHIPRNINCYINKLAGTAVLLKCYSDNEDNFTLLTFSFYRPPVQVIQGFFCEDMAAETWSCLLPLGAEVKNEWSCNSNFPICVLARRGAFLLYSTSMYCILLYPTLLYFNLLRFTLF
jgi:hypothetical protein